MEVLGAWAGGSGVQPGSPGRRSGRPLGWSRLAARACGPRSQRGIGCTSCRRLGPRPAGLPLSLVRWPARSGGRGSAGHGPGVPGKGVLTPVLLQRTGDPHPGEEPSWVVELKPLDVVVAACPLLEYGDQPAVKVEKGHFELFYGSLLSGQYWLLMGRSGTRCRWAPSSEVSSM